MALNAVDGMLAREHGMKSRLGAMLNELGDVVSDTALYLPLALVPGIRPATVVAPVVLAGLAEMAGVVGVQIGASRRYDGPVGKSDRALAFGALCLALGLGAPAGRWLDVLLAWCWPGSPSPSSTAPAGARGGPLVNAALAFLRGRLDPAVAWALAGIFAMLVVATVVLWVLGRLKPQADWSELRARVRTWWMMAGVFALALVLSRRSRWSSSPSSASWP